MKTFGMMALLALLASIAAFSSSMKPETSYNLTGWSTVQWSQSQIIASGGGPLVTSGDGKLRLSANKIMLNLVGKAKGQQTISTAVAVGTVKIHAVAEQGQQIDAVCEKAIIYPSSQRAELSGSVKVNQRDKNRFSGSMELTSDTVTLNLKDGHVVATSRSRRSRLTTTPASGKGH